MTAFSLAGILIALSSFGLGTFVYCKSSHRLIGKLWFLFCFSVGMWGIGIAWIGSNQDPIAGYRAWQISYACGVIWISPLFYHFNCAFLELKRKTSIAIHYFIGAIFLCIVPTKLFFKQADLVFNEFCYIRGGPLYYLFLIWWMGLVIYIHYELIKSFRGASQSKKNQIQYFFLATAIGYTGGFHTYFPKIGIDIYPWGVYTIVIYPIIMTYAILKYNLMDIRIFVRRAVLLIGIYLILLAAAIPILVLVHSKISLSSTIPQAYLLFEVLLAGLVLSSGPVLYALFVRRSNYFQEHTMAGLAHELKSPLASIESALELLNGLEDRKLNGIKESEYLNMIERNSARLRRFIEDLLYSFPLQNGLLQVSSTSVDLNEIIDNLVQEYRPEITARGLSFSFNPTLQPILVHCDPQKIKQTLSNLLSNALKFTSQGTISVAIHKQDGHVLIEVSDNGIGLTQDEAPFIFNQFFQGQRQKSHRGTGIGLTIAKAWIEAHGGRIWAESEGEGKGTTMKFTLPLQT